VADGNHDGLMGYRKKLGKLAVEIGGRMPRKEETDDICIRRPKPTQGVQPMMMIIVVIFDNKYTIKSLSHPSVQCVPKHFLFLQLYKLHYYHVKVRSTYLPNQL
jgi:hypothetical protein